MQRTHEELLIFPVPIFYVLFGCFYSCIVLSLKASPSLDPCWVLAQVHAMISDLCCGLIPCAPINDFYVGNILWRKGVLGIDRKKFFISINVFSLESGWMVKYKNLIDL